MIPHFQTPVFDAGAILVMMPALLVILSEHIGHQVVTSEIVDRNLIRDPGLHRSIFGDNFSTALSGFLGSVPTTTYGENIGVMAVTRRLQRVGDRGRGGLLDPALFHWAGGRPSSTRSPAR